MRKDFLLRVRMNRELVAMIDRQAARLNRSRSAALRSIVEAALANEQVSASANPAKGSPCA